MADKEHLSPPPDLLPGDPGWKPLPRPAFFDDPVEFAKRWEEIEANMPSIEERMRRVRRENPLAGWETMHRRIGPGPSRRPRRPRPLGPSPKPRFINPNA